MAGGRATTSILDLTHPSWSIPAALVAGLRNFTVYGPWGRPDMAPMLVAKAILAGEPIRVYGLRPTASTTSAMPSR